MKFYEPILKAVNFAAKAHGNQKRKYTNEPYITHCVNVAGIVYKDDLTRSDIIVAAILHDVIEDTSATFNDIAYEFGHDVARMVYELTDVPLHRGNRAHRKEMDRQRLFFASAEAQTIKLADALDNLESIVKYDKKFAKVFIEEIELLIPCLQRGNFNLIKRLQTEIKEAKEKLELSEQ